MKLLLFLALIAAPVLGAQPALAAGGKSLGKPSGVVPATVTAIPGTEFHSVELTARAAERIDLKVGKVEQSIVDGKSRKVVPYSSIIYDPNGGTWVYTSPGPRVFVRAAIQVEDVVGDRVILRDGPSVNTKIAIVGVAELYGTEFEVGH